MSPTVYIELHMYVYADFDSNSMSVFPIGDDRVSELTRAHVTVQTSEES